VESTLAAATLRQLSSSECSCSCSCCCFAADPGHVSGRSWCYCNTAATLPQRMMARGPAALFGSAHAAALSPASSAAAMLLHAAADWAADSASTRRAVLLSARLHAMSPACQAARQPATLMQAATHHVIGRQCRRSVCTNKQQPCISCRRSVQQVARLNHQVAANIG
jgi:hypothetical protein